MRGKVRDPKHPYHVWIMVSQDGRRVFWKCASGSKCTATKTTFDGRAKETVE